MPRDRAAPKHRRNLVHMFLAVLLGAAAGLFISGYWLVDFFPADSRQLVALTMSCAAGAAVAYYAGGAALSGRLGALRGRQRVAVILSATGLGCFLFFAGTSQWQLSGRYLAFLLPKHTFRLVASEAPAGTALAWISSSLGDISYGSLRAQGWVRRGDRMVLQNPQHNSIEWSARTGDSLTLVFESSPALGQLQISWDRQQDAILLDRRRTVYEIAFSVPFVASPTLVQLLGLLNFACLSVGLILAGRRLRTAWQGAWPAADVRGKAGHTFAVEILVLLPTMGLAALLRAFNLGGVFPAVDEYFHLIAANQLLMGAPLESVYPRGLWIVTLPVALALRLFGHEVWAARAVGAVFNVLAIVPLYLLGRKISKPVAFVACALYATSPWIITFARMAREYAYYPFYFYWIVYGMVSLVQAIPRGFVAREQWRELTQPRFLLPATLLVFPPIFALWIDWLSTFRTILIAYLVLGAFVVARFDWKQRANWPYLAVVSSVLGLGAWYFRAEQVTKLFPTPRINPVPLEYFFPNPQQQWYFDQIGLLAALAVVLAVAASLALRRRNSIPLFFVALWVSYAAVFALISRSFYHTRHLLSTQLWFVVVLAVGIYWLWQALRLVAPWRGRAVGVATGLGLAFAFVNVNQILLPSLSSNPDMPISEDYLHDFSAVQAYMLNHVEQGDALIATVYGLYATWEDQPMFGQQYRITSATTREEIGSMMAQHASGWIVIDSIRLDISPLSVRELANTPQMEYIGIFGDEHVWRWGPPEEDSSATRHLVGLWISR